MLSCDKKSFLLVTVVIFLLLFPLSNSFGQSVPKTVSQSPFAIQAVPDITILPVGGATPYSVLGNFFLQPNIQVQLGRKLLDWYGSGDVNDDGKIDSLDIATINSGVKNDRADVNLDGVVNQDDAKMLSDYLAGVVYLPAHLNELAPGEQKLSSFKKLMKIEGNFAQQYVYNWVCQNFTAGWEEDFYGVSRTQDFINWYNNAWPGVNFSTDFLKPARFNWPVATATDFATNGVAHALGAFLYGSNPLNFSDWYFFYFQGDSLIQVQPGNFYMDPNKPVSISKIAYVKSIVHGNNIFSNINDMITWDLKDGQGTLVSYQSKLGNGKPFVITQNPALIKLNVKSPGDISVDGGKVSSGKTDLTVGNLESMGYNASPDTTKTNTNLPINFSYADSDTMWSSDSTKFSFKRNFYGDIKTGGYIIPSSDSEKITVSNLIGPNTNLNIGGLENVVIDASKIPKDQSLTPEYLESLGYNAIPDTSKKNTNLPVKLYYSDSNPVWSSDSSSYSFNREFYETTYSFGKTLTDSMKTPQNIKVENITAIEDKEKIIPTKFALLQNYPNPFNPSTVISYNLPVSSHVSLIIYDILGGKVVTLVNKEQTAGEYNITFHAENLPSGIYFYQLKAGNFSSVKKMILLK